MSFGMRSGVHWMRWKVPETAAARVWAAVVFARPGTLSRRTCPPDSRAVVSAVRNGSWPTTRWSNTAETRASNAWARSISSGEIPV